VTPFGGRCANALLSPLEWKDFCGVAPSAGFASVTGFFGLVATPFAATTPWPVNVAAWLVAAIVGLP
jgi:hypothetical protein